MSPVGAGGNVTRRFIPSTVPDLPDLTPMRELEPEGSRPIDRILLMPGLLEPRCAFWPLRWSLRRHCERIEYFPDRLAFRNIQSSVRRLSDLLAQESEDRSIAIVTHSFGDWVARQAIASTDRHAATALVSIAPVMRAGVVTTAAHLITGNLIPEIKVIMDTELAAKNKDLEGNPNLRRLVIWAKADECVRRVELKPSPNLNIEPVAATHLTVVLQPNVIRRITDFLFPVKAS